MGAVGPQFPSVSLVTLVLIFAQIALGLLAVGVGLWFQRRHRSESTRGVAASPTNGPDRGGSPAVSVGMRQVLPDPSFGGWPITGDFLVESARARRPGR